MKTNRETSLIGLSAFKPRQKKFQDGRVFLSVLAEGDKVLALDVRFFREDGNKLTPTRNGFRIPSQSIGSAGGVFKKKLQEIDDVIHVTTKREIHARFVDDKYGQAVDIRYYKKTDDYTGWEKRGLRLRSEDFEEFVRLLEEAELVNGCWRQQNNLFQDREIVDPKKFGSKEQAREPRAISSSRPSALITSVSAYINEALQDLLE